MREQEQERVQELAQVPVVLWRMVVVRMLMLQCLSVAALRTFRVRRLRAVHQWFPSCLLVFFVR